MNKKILNWRMMATFLVLMTAGITLVTFVLASPDTLDITVVNIVTNNTLEGINVTLWNCSNSVLLNQSITDENGTVSLGTNETWNFSIKLNPTTANPNFVPRTYDNDSSCYVYTGDNNRLLHMYPASWASFNVTVSDQLNGRRIPDANVTVWRTNSPSNTEDMDYNLNYNYRCNNTTGACKTDENGNTMVFAKTGLPATNHTLSILHSSYRNKNTTSYTGLTQGSNRDVSVNLKGSQRVEGYVMDSENSGAVPGAEVWILEHQKLPGEGQPMGYDNTYFYHTTTDSDGYYVIYAPTDLIGSNYYDLKVNESRYITKIERDDDGSGFVGFNQRDIDLTGILMVTGEVRDVTNNQAISGVSITVNENYNSTGQPTSPAFTYTDTANSTGGFSVRIRNNTNYTVKADYSGYNFNSTSGLSGNQSMGIIYLTGKANITGTVIDQYNNQIKLGGASVTITQGVRTYSTTTSPAGNFGILIRSGEDYDITISKAGYFSHSQTGLSASDGTNSLGSIELAGRAKVTGNVQDGEDAGKDRILENVNVNLTVPGSNYYDCKTDSSGNFNINISSNVAAFNVSLNFNGYYDRLLEQSGVSPGEQDLGIIYMTGTTKVNGTVIDSQSPSIDLSGVTLEFKRASDGTVLYETETDQDSAFEVDMGLTSDYNVVASKSGYRTRTLDNNTYNYAPEENVTLSIAMDGTATVSGNVLEGFSSRKGINQPVYAAKVYIYEKGQTNHKYWDEVNGSFSFDIDGAFDYRIVVDATGYPKTADDNSGDCYNGNLTKNYTLTAYYEAEVTDSVNNQPIKNAMVEAYHNYNSTAYGNNTVNETIANVTVYCDGALVDAVNVTLNKTTCKWFQNATYLDLCERTQETSSGRTDFRTVPTGTYNITINASQISCANYTELVRTVDMPGQEYNWTFHLGRMSNLSVHVLNSSSVGVDGVNVSIGSTLYNDTKLTGSGGWANFTNLPFGEVINYTILANGTNLGYNHKTDVVTISSSMDAVSTLVLGETHLKVNVIDGGNVIGANVTLYNNTDNSIALNATGGKQTGLSNGIGVINFTRLIPGTYNLTVNATGQGFDYYTRNTTVSSGSNEVTVNLNDTQAPWYDSFTITPDSTPDEGDVVDIDADLHDNGALSLARFYISESNTGPWTLQDSRSLSMSSEHVKFTLSSGWTDSNVGKTFYYWIWFRDTENNINTTNSSTPVTHSFTIQDITDPTISIEHEPTSPRGDDVVTFSASASDESNVSVIEIWVDYVKRKTCVINAPSGTCGWTGGPWEPDSWHNYYARANDTFSNWGTHPDEQEDLDVVATLPDPLSSASAVYHPDTGKIYIIGGYDESNAPVDIIREFDSSDYSVSSFGTLPSGRGGISAAYDGNHNITVFGGHDGNQYLKDIVGINVTDGSTGIVDTLPHNLSGTAAVYNENDYRIYIAGGGNSTGGQFNASDDIYNYTTSYGIDDTGYDLVYKLFGISAAIDEGSMFVFGGWNGTDASNRSEEFLLSCTGDAGKHSDILPSARLGTSAAYFPPNDRIYIFGGRDNYTGGGYSNQVLEYHANIPGTAATVKSSTLSPARSYTSAVYDPNKQKIYIFGGQIHSPDNATDEILEYSPVGVIDFKIDPPLPEANLNVTVKDTDGNFLEDIPLSLSGPDSYSNSTLTDTSGEAVFVIDPVDVGGTYTLDTDGSEEGFGINQTSIQMAEGDNSILVILNITKLTANVTEPDYTPVQDAVVTVYNETGDIARNGLGSQLKGTTNSDGLVHFTRVLPCTNCNLSVDKGSSWNSTLFTITAGQNKNVWVDPVLPPSLGDYDYYYTGVLEGNNTVIISVTNSSGEGIHYVNVSFYNANTTVLYNSSLTDSDGNASVTVRDGVYDIVVYGDDAGYGRIRVNNTMIGKLVFANGTTDANGKVNFIVDGQPNVSVNVPADGYYVKIRAPGYNQYNSLDESRIFQGTYFDSVSGSNPDVQNSFEKNLTGQAAVAGNVSDATCVNTDSVCRIWYGTVNIRYHEGEIRYTTMTDENGSYSINVSPYTTSSTLDSKMKTSYDIEIEKSGYQDNNSINDKPTGIKLSEGSVYDRDATMRGSGQVQGHILYYSGDPIIGADVDFITAGDIGPRPVGSGTEYYKDTTDSNGEFDFVINPEMSPYRLMISPPNAENFTNGPFSGTQTGLNFYLFSPNSGAVDFNVTTLTGSPLGLVNITMDSMGAGDDYNLVTDSNGTAFLQSITNYTYNVTIDGSHLGYGINNSMVPIQANKFNNLTYELNATVVNITVYNDQGQPIGNVTVNMTYNPSFQNVTDSNGGVVFSVVPTGTYNITFSGDEISTVYFIAGSNQTQFNVTAGMAGKVNDVNYTFNETRAVFNITNQTGSSLTGLNLTITNSTGNLVYNNTGGNSTILLKGIVYGNYTLAFNDTQLYERGYIPQNPTFAVQPGQDENTSNLFSVTMSDIEAVFNVSNTTGDTLDNVVIQMLLDGSPASNALGAPLNGSTNSTGDLVMHLVKPEQYANGTYTYNLFANSTGYGDWYNYSGITVGLNGTLENVQLEPLSLTVHVNENGGSLSESVNISLMQNGQLAMNANGEYLNATGVTDNTTFTHLFVGNYTINITSASYFSQTRNISTVNLSQASQSESFNLTSRTVNVFLYENSGFAANPVTVTLYNSTGGVARNTTGQYINGTTSTGTISFTGVKDGVFSINVTSDSYFNQSTSFDTTTTPTFNFTFNLSARTVNVFLREVNTQNLVTDNVTVTLYNSTGGVARNTTGQYINGTTDTGTITFTGVKDGVFSINTTSATYFNTSTTFNTATAPSFNFTMNMSARQVWVNIYERVLKTAITENMTVGIYNSTGIETNTTGSPMQKNTTSGSVLFEGVRTGQFNISVSGENFTTQNQTLDTSTGPYTFDFYMNRTNTGYFNVTVTSSGNPVSGITVNLMNASNTVDSGSTGSDGEVLFGINSSRYTSLNVTTDETSSYYANTSGGEYSVLDQVIQNITVTISSKPSGDGNGNGDGNGDGGGTGGAMGGGAAPCNESWVCTEWSACINGTQNRTCTDQNECGTEEDKPVTSRSCVVKMSLSAQAAYLNADQCQSMLITVENEGTVPLTDVKLSDSYSIPNCCSLSSAKSVSIIEPEDSRTLAVTVCAPKTSTKGDYSKTIAVETGETSGTLLVYAYITKNYQEVLIDRADSLLQDLEDMDTSQFDTVQMSWYSGAKADLEQAKEQAQAENTDTAEGLIQSAQDKISKIESYTVPEQNMWWLLYLLIPVAVGAGIFIYWRRMPGEKGFEYEPKPTAGPAAPARAETYSKEHLLKSLKDIESRVKDLDGKKLGDVEAQYHEKASHALDIVKKHIVNDNMVSAKKALNAAERELKVLESRLMSLKLMKDLKK